MEHFHLLRPAWLWALLPLALLLLLLWRGRSRGGIWRRSVDPHLLPHLLLNPQQRRVGLTVLLLALGWVIAVVALSGPVWKQRPQPVFRAEQAHIVLLDLSLSMESTDIRPSRLVRARHKLQDLLRDADEGQWALVVFSEFPYVITPLTHDSDTITALIPTLSSELMPSLGSRPDRALEKADELLRQAGIETGKILLIGDESSPSASVVAQRLRAQGRQISVLAVGTEEGAPISWPWGVDKGSLVKDSSGAIAIPRLDRAALRELAHAGGGLYQELRNDNRDIEALRSAMAQEPLAPASREEEMSGDQWFEEGPYLLLLLLPLAALGFRRGWVFAGALWMVSPDLPAWEWSSLWQNADQRGARALAEERPQEAAEQFQDPRWRGVAHYRSGDYLEAAEQFASSDDPEANYNRGNALARAGRLSDALKAYQEVLEVDPEHADARFNHDLLEQLLEQQQREQSSDQEEDDEGKENPDEGGEGEGESGGENQEQNTEQSDGTSNTESEESGQGAEPEEQESEPAEESASERGEQQESDPQSRGRRSNDESEPREPNGEQESISESDQALEQWLRRIPEDPAGLIRNKLRLDYRRYYESKGMAEPQPW